MSGQGEPSESRSSVPQAALGWSPGQNSSQPAVPGLGNATPAPLWLSSLQVAGQQPLAARAAAGGRSQGRFILPPRGNRRIYAPPILPDADRQQHQQEAMQLAHLSLSRLESSNLDEVSSWNTEADKEKTQIVKQYTLGEVFSQISSLKVENSFLTFENKSLLENGSVLSEENSRLHEDVRLLAEEVSRLRSAVAAASDPRAAEAIEVLRNAHVALRASYNRVREENAKLQEMVQDARRVLSQDVVR